MLGALLNVSPVALVGAFVGALVALVGAFVGALVGVLVGALVALAATNQFVMNLRSQNLSGAVTGHSHGTEVLQ